MQKLLSSLKTAYPQVTFTAGTTFSWSPETNEIFYTHSSDKRHIWSLLHETGHALLGHQSYQADIELLKMEVAAWHKAKELAEQLEVDIDEDHIQDCLDTYRDWLHARSVCPTCTTKAIQQSDMKSYKCHNCHTLWKVTPSRFCRAYRSVKNVAQPLPTFAAEL